MTKRIRAGKKAIETKKDIRAILPDETLMAMAKGKRAVMDARIISPSRVVTAAWVKMKCRFGCDGYGRCLALPSYMSLANQGCLGSRLGRSRRLSARTTKHENPAGPGQSRKAVTLVVKVDGGPAQGLGNPDA